MEHIGIQSLLQEDCLNLEARIMELEADLAGLKKQIFSVLEELPEENRLILESYLYQLAELQLHMVIQSFKKGKAIGQKTRETRKKK